MNTNLAGAKMLRNLISLGEYEWVSPEINDESVTLEMLKIKTGSKYKVFRFGRKYISSYEVEKKMCEQGYRAGNLGDLLVFGAKNLRHPLKIESIVALDTIIEYNNIGCHPTLFRDTDGRNVSVCKYMHWERNFCFLGVLK